MGTLEDLDDGNGPLIIRVPENNTKGKCRSPLGQVQISPEQHKYEKLMPQEMILYLLCDANSSLEDHAIDKIWKSACILKKSFN